MTNLHLKTRSMIFRNENAVERRGGPFLDIFFPRNVPPRWWSSGTKTCRNAQKSSVTAQLRLFVVYSFYFNLCLELYQHGHQRCSDSHQAVRLTCPLCGGCWVLKDLISHFSCFQLCLSSVSSSGNFLSFAEICIKSLFYVIEYG
jgi:hypothetical protein